MTEPLIITGIAAAVLTSTGDLAEITLSFDLSTRIHELHRHIGCSTFDVVTIDAELDMWLDDEGLLTGRQVNLPAMRVAHKIGGRMQPYVGTVVFTGGADDEGETVALTPRMLGRIRETLSCFLDY